MKSGKKFFIWLGRTHVTNGGARSSIKRREWPGWAQGAWDHGRYLAIYCKPLVDEHPPYIQLWREKALGEYVVVSWSWARKPQTYYGSRLCTVGFDFYKSDNIARIMAKDLGVEYRE